MNQKGERPSRIDKFPSPSISRMAATKRQGLKASKWTTPAPLINTSLRGMCHTKICMPWWVALLSLISPSRARCKDRLRTCVRYM